ncbi:neutral zinc metallopeptidase [Novosphingobium sp. TH158]|uniref:KPN_02809 family neutral zinc metallopeptidase n=1 Tax=Novosphingobium sp. TH158 TaxID=2067455 RepID=UPI000C7D25AF|nr:neutral zinc metallopeptidase [Novosphingobium sp. TH158]PLK25529.1 zinc metalloprotease [Novosphingobium sp. TH158]
MRLDDLDPNQVDIDDQRGRGGGFPGLGGGGFPLPIGGGKMGCGTILLLIVLAFVFQGDIGRMFGGMGETGGTLPGQQQAQVEGSSNASESCKIDQASMESCQALQMLNRTWEPLFRQASIPFDRPTLHFYSQSGQSGCGAAQSAMGPFYCPSDEGIYLDTDFYKQMDRELGAKGQFARLYVIAHEYGHHIQNELGTSKQVRQLQERNPRSANPLSVRLELQADCYAGVWAAKNADRLEPGDMESGLNAAKSIGDDTLMANAGRRPVEEAFTHGSSAQRMQWLRKGMETGNEDACDTFADLKR